MFYILAALMVALAAVAWHCLHRPNAGPLTYLIAALAAAGFILLGIFIGFWTIFMIGWILEDSPDWILLWERLCF